MGLQPPRRLGPTLRIRSIMHRMSRTFSLGRLMVGVTVFCVLCGLAVNFPEMVIGWAFIDSIVGPPAVIWLVLSRFAKWRGSLLWNVSIGAVLGLVVGALFVCGCETFWLAYAKIEIPSSLGAFVFGVVGLLDECIASRRDRPVVERDRWPWL